MTTKIFYEADTNIKLLNGKTIAIIGYGAQGRAHAQNVRDSGCQVIVGQRTGGQGHDHAVEDGFTPVSIAAAAEQADLVNVLLPDEVHGDVFKTSIEPHLKPGNVVMACHGFSFHYGLIETADGIDRLLVAPKGQGHMVRGEYLRGGGVPCLIATDDDADPETLQLGLAYAAALGGAKAGILQTTIAAETETDLFGEQVVLCGGVSELVKAGFETLVEAGYQPEMAYFECMHELKLIVDLFYEGGLNYMRYSVSNTAEFGDYTRGPRIITDETKKTMKKILQEIQGGEFAKEWILENKAGAAAFKARRRLEREHGVEKVGVELRRLMKWIDSKEV